MLEEEVGVFTIAEPEVFKVITFRLLDFIEKGVNSGADTAMRKDYDMLVGVAFFNHGQKFLNAELHLEQGFFAVVGFRVTVVIVPNLGELD